LKKWFDPAKWYNKPPSEEPLIDYLVIPPHVTCPSVDKTASSYWDALSRQEKEKLKTGHLNYDWSNRTVAVREAFAYFFEDKPLKVLDYIGNCQM